MIRLVLVDDHQLFVAGLREYLTSQPEFQVVGVAGDGREALSVVAAAQPDVVLLDMSMPGMSGVECARRLAVEQPASKLLALSMHNDLTFIAELLRIGAKGYVLKDSNPEDLLRAIRAVAEGQIYLSEPVVGLVVEDYLRLRTLVHDQDMRSDRLSEREKTVLMLMTTGLTGKAIADQLGISKNTVDTHRRRMMDKLGCNSVAELMRYAIREGLIDLS